LKKIAAQNHITLSNQLYPFRPYQKTPSMHINNNNNSNENNNNSINNNNNDLLAKTTTFLCDNNNKKKNDESNENYILNTQDFNKEDG
jgi:hypothetical protein